MLKVKCPVYCTAYPEFSLNTEAVNGFYKKIEPGKVIHSVYTADYEYYVATTSEEGVFKFGARQLKDTWDHKAGYIWSSRCSVMNKLFVTRLVEVSINSTHYAMDVDFLKTLVDRDVADKFDVVQHVDDKGEVSYRFVKQPQ